MARPSLVPPLGNGRGHQVSWSPGTRTSAAENLVAAYHDWLRQAKASLPVGLKIRRALSQIYRSKGERFQIAGYYSADFTVEIDGRLAQAG